MPAPFHGQVAVSGTAQPLAATPLVSAGFTVKAPLTNLHLAYIGASGVTSGNGFPLAPGDTFDYVRNSQAGAIGRFELNVSDFYVVGTAGDIVGWLASPEQS